MKKRRILNASETRTEDTLRAALDGTGYRVFARLPLSKLLQREPSEILSKADRRFLESSELDFVVANPESVPEFAVEFDGPFHQLDKSQAARDVRKNRLCNLAHLSLWRITDTELEEFDRYTILEFIIMRFLAWRDESEDISRRIAQHISTLDETQKEALIAGGIADPSIDPTFHFHIAHPFPRIVDVAKRLLERHRIVSLVAEPFLAAISPQEPFWLFCDVSAPSQRSDGHDLIVRRDYIVLRSREPFFGIKSIGTVLDRNSSEVVTKGSLDFRIRTSLPIVSDYDPREPPVEYFMRRGTLPISFPGLPGVTPDDIAEAVSEYLGFRQVEQWADEENQK